jgi:hypothetical protein
MKSSKHGKLSISSIVVMSFDIDNTIYVGGFV